MSQIPRLSSADLGATAHGRQQAAPAGRRTLARPPPPPQPQCPPARFDTHCRQLCGQRKMRHLTFLKPHICCGLSKPKSLPLSCLLSPARIFTRNTTAMSVSDVVIGVVATRKKINTMEMSSVVTYTQDTLGHNSMSAKELKAPTHTTTQASCILYIGSVGIPISSAESLKEDIKPNFRTPPRSCNLAGEF